MLQAIQEWGMAFTDQFIYIGHHFLLLSLNDFRVTLDWDEC